jgi:hypothetical protein
MNEKLEATIQELRDIVYQKKFNAGLEILEMRFLIGEVLVNSPLWKRETRVELLNECETALQLGDRSLRYCAEFYEKYGTFQKVLDQADPDHKLPAWREIVKELPSARKEKEEPVEKCKHCKLHCNG